MNCFILSLNMPRVVELKKAERNLDTDDLGKYFSALSNEANLRGVIEKERQYRWALNRVAEILQF